MLGKQIRKHKSDVWLVNTGWTGGPYGIGERINLPYTRAMVSAALNGKLSSVSFRKDPVFGLQVPENCPDVPDDVLDPRKTWENPADYDQQAQSFGQPLPRKL